MGAGLVTGGDSTEAWLVLEPGREIWFPVVPAPGRYFMICHVAAADGCARDEPGLVRTFGAR